MRIALVVLALAALASPAAAVGERFKVKLKKPARGFQMRASPYVVPGGQDLEWCEYRRLPNKREMLAQSFELRMSYGSHHFVVWAYNGTESDDSKFPSKPVLSAGCGGLGPGDFFMPVNLFGMQTPNGRVKFPTGIAVRLKARQQVWINPHIKNFGTDDVVPEAVFNLSPARKGSVKHVAESFAIGNVAGVDLPAGGKVTLTSEWAAPQALNIIQVSTHQHALGTYASVEIEQADGTFTRVFEGKDWEHPGEMWTHETAPWKDLATPVIRLEQGQRIRWTCKWHNTTSERVTFGTETTNEMCFATGYYYRDDGAPKGPIRGVGCIDSVEGLTCPVVNPTARVVEE
jgi:Copper type II ascorbate-dependent monooxygenase, C-terminal domain